MQWFVKPETVRVNLPGNEWLELKKRLTVGEQRRAMASLVTEFRGDGRMTPNLEMVGKTEAMAYLVDWSLRDEQGRHVPIDGSDAQKLAALNSLSPEAFDLIAGVIAEHVKAMDAERDAEKNVQDGESKS